jgi:hypothetical protein
MGKLHPTYVVPRLDVDADRLRSLSIVKSAQLEKTF